MPPLILTSTPRTRVEQTRAEGPRSDFYVLAQSTGGTISYPGGGCGPVRAAQARFRFDMAQAVRASRAEPATYVSFSERVGLPLALIGPKAPQLMVAHWLTSPSKRWAQRVTGFLNHVDLTLVFSRAQERYLRNDLGLGPERARFVSDKVDQRFFFPLETDGPGDYVVAVGREQRDYPTLVQALRPLNLPCVIVPGSAWSHRDLGDLALPDHVELQLDLSYTELRELYQRARMVVVPIFAGTDYAAGVNAVLEGMACGRPVIASDTPGLESYVDDGVNGRHVPPGDPGALREVIAELWEDTTQRQGLGAAGRRTVECRRTVDGFAAQLAEWMAAVE